MDGRELDQRSYERHNGGTTLREYVDMRFKEQDRYLTAEVARLDQLGAQRAIAIEQIRLDVQGVRGEVAKIADDVREMCESVANLDGRVMVFGCVFAIAGSAVTGLIVKYL